MRNRIKVKLRNRRKLSNTEVNSGEEHSRDTNAVKTIESDSDKSTAGEEDKRKTVGRLRKKKKAVDPSLVEQEIVKKAGRAPEHLNTKLLRNMTASDISAQALEYLGNIELIRVKSGRLQEGLSGELRKRTQCLEKIIRTFQFKAEASGIRDC